MSLFPGADGSRPAGPLPPGTRILAAYVGKPGAGAPDTPHIWAPDEWNTYLRADPDLGVLPIGTHSYDDGDPYADANNACDAAEALGWAAHLPDPDTRIMLYDLETLVDRDYVQDIEHQTLVRGFVPVPYGSSYFVRQNPAPAGYWDAIWTPRIPTVLPPDSLGVQYRGGDPWDLTMWRPEVLARCGRGLRHGG